MKEIMIKHIPMYYSRSADQSSSFSWNAENAETFMASADMKGKKMQWGKECMEFIDF